MIGRLVRGQRWISRRLKNLRFAEARSRCRSTRLTKVYWMTSGIRPPWATSRSVLYANGAAS